MIARPIVVVAVCLLLVAPARAQDKKRASVLFEQGRAMLSSGDFEGACAKFGESQTLDPKVGTLLNLADCEERRGHLVVARERWAEAGELARKEHDARGKIAEQRAEKLAERVPQLEVRLASGAPPETTVDLERDDKNPAPALTLGTPLRLDPGRYRVAVRAPGRETQTVDVVLAEGDKRGLLVAPGAASNASEPPSEPSGAAVGTPSGGWSPWRTAGIVVGGVGIVAVGVGIGFGVVAINKKDEAEPHCDEANTCDDEGIALREDGLTAAHVSTGMFIGGGVLFAAGLTMFLVAPRGDDETAAVRVVVSPTGAALRTSW